MVRVTSDTMVSGSQLYSYLDIEGRGTNATTSYYDLRGGVTSGYYWDLTCSSFLKWWENGVGHDIDSGSGYYGGYSDLQLVSSDSFAVTRTSSDRYITFECYSTSSLGNGSARYTVEVPHLPGAPTNLTATRISDNRIDLSWTNPSLPYGGFYLQVSIDGGSWSNAWSVENVMPTSYSYTQASAGHSYKFRAYTGHWYAFSAYSNETAIISMTPAAPQSISVAASGGTNVTVTLSNDSPVATSLEYQTSTDGGSTWSASSTVSGSPVTSFSTSVSGTALIRVRNKNATGVSAWLVSDPITTICPPAAPTLRTPSGSVYDMALGDIEFSWLHNSLDGSTQTAYQLRYARNGGAWTTLSGTTAQSRTVSLGTFTAGDSVTWQVRTKGADANYSDWSPSGVFNVYTAPTVSISSPGATITGMPINLTATYSDMAGFTCQAATVSLQKDGRTLYSENAAINGTSITSSLDVSEFLPTNGESYTVVLTARSSSGLSTSANATFLVSFIEPQAGELQITNDPETGYVSILATFDNSASEITYTGATNAQYESSEGYVRSLTVEGKSKKWNQQNSAASIVSLSGGNMSASTNKICNNAVGNHVYFFSMNVINATVSDVGLYQANSNRVAYFPSTSTGVKEIIASAKINGYIGIYASANTTGWTTETEFADKILSIDLTAIFGAGNEPATVDAFKATDVYKAKLAAGELYDYDAGSLVSIEGVGVRGRNLGSIADVSQSVSNGAFYNTYTGFVLEGGKTYTISADIESTIEQFRVSCGYDNRAGYDSSYKADLNGSDITLRDNGRCHATFTAPAYADGKNLWMRWVRFFTQKTYSYTVKNTMVEYGSTAHAYEPYSLATITTPLRSAGSVHDTLMADADSWTVWRKVGVVDLGTLTWTYGSPWFKTSLPVAPKEPAGDHDVPNALCAMLGTDAYAYTGDKELTIIYASSGAHGQLWVKDSSYTDAASFKAAMSGVYLFYELATPTQDPETSMDTIEIGSAFTVATDLDSTFEMTTWDGSADAVSVSVSRVNADGSITPLLTDGASGSGIVDRYAPLNTSYRYAVTTKAASQAVSTVYFENKIETPRWFAYWGENIAWARWNPKGGITITRPEKKRVHYVGRTYPVSYDSLAIDQQNTLKVKALLDEWSDGFADLMRDGGRGVYKGADGSVFWADFEYSTSADYASATRIDEVSLTITRIDGEKL